MTKGLLRSLRRATINSGGARVLTMDLPLRAFVVSNIDGATGVGWGSAIMSGLPEGNILLLGAVLNATITEADAGIIATFSGDFAVGTTPVSDATISAGDEDIIVETAMGPATASVVTIRGASTATLAGAVFDNTAGTLELNLNILIDDASISADDTSVTVEGALHFAYALLGDD